MLSNILTQIKQLDKTDIVDTYITKLQFSEWFTNINFLNINLLNGSDQDIYDVKNTFKYINLINRDIVRKYLQVLIIDDYKMAKFYLNNNYIKYLILLSNEKCDFDHFILSNNASTQHYKVYINTQSAYDKLYSSSFKPTNNIELLAQNKDVNIIIPIFNNTAYTIKCLKTVLRNPSSIYHVNIILIDNGSDEKSIKTVQDFCSKWKQNDIFNIILLKQPKNIGYLSAVNLGIEYSLKNFHASYTVLLHNDSEVSTNWLDNLLKPIKDNTVAAVPITSDMTIDQGYPTIRQKNLVPNFPESFYRLKTNDIVKLLQDQYNDTFIDINPRQIKVKMFCIAFNTLIFSKLGLLDPAFGEGFSSDEDYIARIYLNGYNIKLVPSVSIKHSTSTTFRIWNDRAQDLIKLRFARHIQYQLLNTLNIEKNKKSVIYTCKFIVNDNQKELSKSVIPTLSFIDTENFDYIYFTDSDELQVPEPWLKINIRKMFRLTNYDDYDTELFKNFIKINPHLFFRNYIYSIFIEENYDIINNLLPLINGLNNNVIFTPKNNTISNIKDYCDLLKIQETEKPEKINKFYNFILTDEHISSNEVGFFNTNIIVRKHRDKNCIKAMNLWWQCITKFSYNDQLSFTYIILRQKLNIVPAYQKFIDNKYIRNLVNNNKL